MATHLQAHVLHRSRSVSLACFGVIPGWRCINIATASDCADKLKANPEKYLQRI